MKRLAWTTDLHLNFVSPRHVERLCRSVIDTSADAVLLTGLKVMVLLVEPKLAMSTTSVGLLVKLPSRVTTPVDTTPSAPSSRPSSRSAGGARPTCPSRRRL